MMPILTYSLVRTVTKARQLVAKVAAIIWGPAFSLGLEMSGGNIGMGAAAAGSVALPDIVSAVCRAPLCAYGGWSLQIGLSLRRDLDEAVFCFSGAKVALTMCDVPSHERRSYQCSGKAKEKTGVELVQASCADPRRWSKRGGKGASG